MVVAIPLLPQSDYTELKYALRSIEKYLPDMEVVIMGTMVPPWLCNITQIQVADIPGKKQLSIRKKVLAALNYTDKIFFSNDDIFLLTATDPHHYPYYSKGSLLKEPEAGAQPLRETLTKLGKPLHHFDCHYPIVYEKQKFEALEAFPSSCIIKSMYGNYHHLTPTVIQDCKVVSKTSEQHIRSMLSFLPCLSTGPHGLPYALPYLKALFPDKSKFEW